MLAANDARWVGLALVRLESEEAGAAVLNAMWVAPEVRGRGAAGRLCFAGAARATERGCRELTLTVVADNQAARHVYETAGFVIRGQAKWARHGRALDAWAMARSL